MSYSVFVYYLCMFYSVCMSEYSIMSLTVYRYILQYIDISHSVVLCRSYIVFLCLTVQKAINPCQVMHTGRMTSLSLAPSHNDTTCYSLCSIRPADRPADRPTDRPADRPEIGRSEVFIQWNFLDKSRVNNVMFRVLDDSEHSKLWTNVNRFSQRTLQLYNRIIQIKFNLSNVKSIKRILISVEYGKFSCLFFVCTSLLYVVIIRDVILHFPKQLPFSPLMHIKDKGEVSEHEADNYCYVVLK